MTVALTNFSDEAFNESRQRLNESALRFGIKTIFTYSKEDVWKSEFYQENKVILDLPRGVGYWLWKPYIILESLKQVSEGDIVIYADSGLEIIADLTPLIKICKNDAPVLLFGNGNLINAEWTKRDCFVLTKCDNSAAYQARQADGALCLFQKNKYTVDFVEEWLSYGQDPRMFTDMPNTLGKPNSWRFIEHRHDQSVLSLMAFKKKMSYYRIPSQFGNHYKEISFRVLGEFNVVNQKRLRQVKHYSKNPYQNSPYFQLIDQHRSKNSLSVVVGRSFIKKLESRIRSWL